LGRFTDRSAGGGEGRPPCARVWLAHAFIAKRVYQFPSPGALLDARRPRPPRRRLCGWDSAGDIPSAPTFRRAFAALAQDQLPQRIHETMVKTHAGNKRVGHVRRAAPAIAAPERPAPKPAAAPKVPAKRNSKGHQASWIGYKLPRVSRGWGPPRARRADPRQRA